MCAHVVSAAKQVIKTVDVLGDCKAVAKAIVQQFVQVSLPSPEQISCPPTDDSEVSLPSAEQASCPPTDDSVYNYATDFLHWDYFGMVFMMQFGVVMGTEL